MVPVHVVIVTAEPLGAYHLEPLHASMREAARNGNQFTHLIPYPETVQGIPWDAVTANIDILELSHLVVLTGGGFTTWTELVARRCEQLNIPFVVTELAYGTQTERRNLPAPAAISALSPAGAENLALYHKVDLGSVVVTGTPLLDSLPAWEPTPGHVLILSSVGATQRDPEQLLITIARHLEQTGHDVVIRCHPREDRTPWSDFAIDTCKTPAEGARNAERVVGYPGSAHAVVAALGVPVVAVAPNLEMRRALPPQLAAAIPTWVSSTDDIKIILSAPPTDASMITFVNGPIGGSSARVVEFWLKQAGKSFGQRL
jgi:hypothetical protein